MFGGNGLMGILLIAGLAILAVMVVRALMARRRQQEVMQPVQYAGMRESVDVPVATASASAPIAATPTAIPAGFDASGFLRAAKLNFLKLQQANDAGKLDEIREFTTDELYEELRKDFGRSAPAVHRHRLARRRPARVRHRGQPALGERALLRAPCAKHRAPSPRPSPRCGTW
jgi:predicted lipid-binding transport protein (Tim44 family)